ncbi:MAG: organomercurial lyase [Kofleriaceae bacterium]
MALAPLDATVRAAINAGFLAARGAPPTADELAARTGLSRDEIFDSLRRLDALGSVSLRPQTLELWTAPPFSATPTLFRVNLNSDLYWGSCAWSALGVCALAGQPGTIRGSLGGEGEDVEVTVGEDGPSAPMPLLVHFAIPAARWADSLPYTHNMTLLFRTVDEVDSWAERRRLPRGAVVPIQQAWKLAVEWYGGGATPEPHLRHRAELEAIFSKCDLGQPHFMLRPRHLW